MMILSILAAATAAVTPPDITILSAIDRSKIAAEVSIRMKDPDATLFRWPPVGRDPSVYCGWVNGKNGYGGYTGYSLFLAVLTRASDGSITAISINLDDERETFVKSSCAHFGYITVRPPTEPTR